MNDSYSPALQLDDSTTDSAQALQAKLRTIAAAVQAKIADGQMAAPAQSLLMCPSDPAEREACDSCQ